MMVVAVWVGPRQNEITCRFVGEKRPPGPYDLVEVGCPLT